MQLYQGKQMVQKSGNNRPNLVVMGITAGFYDAFAGLDKWKAIYIFFTCSSFTCSEALLVFPATMEYFLSAHKQRGNFDVE